MQKKRSIAGHATGLEAMARMLSYNSVNQLLEEHRAENCRYVLCAGGCPATHGYHNGIPTAN
jgi:hypothetical protein